MATDFNDWTHNYPTARVPVPVKTSRAPGRRARWAAEIGHWNADGSTEREALTNLTNGLSAFVAAYRHPEIVTFGGCVAVVSVDANTWETHEPQWVVQIVGPDGSRPSFSGMSATGWDEALASVRANLAQRVTDWHNDASVHAGAAFVAGGERYGYGQHGPEEFYRYAAWQRAAKAAMDAGRDDWHGWASEHRADFAVPISTV